jgi:plasmid stabilization system protein ParE
MRFFDAFDSALSMIESMPEAAGKLLLDEHDYPGYRFCRLKSFRKYLIIYHVASDAIQVVRVLHGSRDLPAALQSS